MDNIVIVKDDQLRHLIDHYRRVVAGYDAGAVRSYRVCVDGGFKGKVNEYTWSPPYGEMED